MFGFNVGVLASMFVVSVWRLMFAVSVWRLMFAVSVWFQCSMFDVLVMVWF